MNQFISLTATSAGASITALFNSGRISNVSSTPTGCKFSYKESETKTSKWETTTNYATVKAAIANFDAHVKAEFDVLTVKGTAHAVTEEIDGQDVVFVIDAGSSTSDIYVDKLGRKLKYNVNHTYAAVTTLLNTVSSSSTTGTFVDLTVTNEITTVDLTVSGTATIDIAEITELDITTTGGDEAANIVSTAQTTNSLVNITTDTAVTSAALMKAITVSMETTAASAVNMIEVAHFEFTSEVKVGVWANAVCAKIDFGATGYVTGLAGVVCAELSMPTTSPAGGAGTYTCFEAEIDMAGASGGTPVSAMTVNVWGAQAADFDTNGFLFDISGLTKASGKIFQDNTAGAASQALRCRINGTPYYIMLTSTGA